MGEAIVGATLLGAAKSLPGMTASVTAAVDGKPQMALSNAIGGIAALLLGGLLYREKSGLAGIGFESVGIIIIYLRLLGVMVFV